MSVDYTTWLICGIKVKRSDLMPERKVSGCAHPKKGAKFCPECGKQSWTTEPRPVKGYDEDSGGYLGYRVYPVGDSGSDEVIVGKQVAEVRSDGPFLYNPSTLDSVRAFMLKKSEEWDLKGTFGVWLVLYCSY